MDGEHEWLEVEHKLMDERMESMHARMDGEHEWISEWMAGEHE